MQADIEALKARAVAGDAAALAPLALALDAAGRAGEATELLAGAANQGSAEARYLVGARLLVGLGAPMLPQDGLRLVSESAQESAGAAHLLAVLHALGAVVGQDFKQALGHLRNAAELGSELGRGELALLSADRELAAQAHGGGAPRDVWARLCAAIDVGAWTRPAASSTLSESPQVAAFPGLIEPQICAWLIDRSRGRLDRAKVYSGAAPSIDGHRSNSSTEFDLLASDVVTALVQARIASAAGVQQTRLEPLAVLHYAPGEQFRDHFDFVDPRSPDAARDVARLGQRVITFLVYLNEEFGGGETAFKRIGITYKGRMGEGLLFHNVTPEGEPDPRTLHAGLAPTDGEKWIVSQFVRGRPILPGSG